ncbi:MAG: MFS transporter [Pseudomonadales bacterium]
MTQPSILRRIRAILFAIFAVALSHNLFFVVLPIRLSEGGFDTGDIGLAMSMFAVGAVMAGLFGSRAVLRAGHVRAFATMVATLSIVSIVHSYSNDIWLTGLLRIVAGFCFVASFITLESWLNVLSDQSNRGKVFSIYQICFAVGFGVAPFLFSFSSVQDPRLFGLLSIFLCISLIIMAMSRLPQPELPARGSAMALGKLWRYSPSGTLSCVCAGLISSASVSLLSLYAYERGISGIWLSLALGSFQMGGLLSQYPTGWLADRYDKRSVAAGLMVIGVVSNALIVMENFVAMPTSVLIFLFLVSGGSGVALFPLAVTQVFDHIESKEAMPATSTMQILLGAGGIAGPIIAGFLMNAYGALWLYYYLIAVHAFVMIFLLTRKLFVRTQTLEASSPFKVTVQPTSMGASELDPRINYSLAKIDNPELKLLLVALAQQPRDPRALIDTALQSSMLTASDVAINMVLALPKQAGELVGLLIDLYPTERLSVALSLHDLWILRKERINAMILKALEQGASSTERAELAKMMADLEKV